MRRVKQCFISESFLHQFDSTKVIHIFTDASGYTAASILMQWHDKHLHPVAFWLGKFTTPEYNYTIIEQGLLPIVNIMSHWRYYYKGTQHSIQVYIDYHNLQYFNSLEYMNGCLACWSLQLQHFEYEIHYRPGWKNPADTLSCYLDYCVNTNDPSQPAKLHLKFYIMYPKHCDPVLELSLDIMLQPNELHEKISSTYQIDKYLLSIDSECP